MGFDDQGTRVMTLRISIAKQFSRYPAGRFYSDGEFSGERFREEILKPALNNGSVELDLDGVAGLPSSFLEEVMGGLVRCGVEVALIRERLDIVSSSPRVKSYREQAWRYIDEAAHRAFLAA
jgi:hypothetical protein